MASCARSGALQLALAALLVLLLRCCAARSLAQQGSEAGETRLREGRALGALVLL